MWTLRVSLLWALLSMARGDVREISARPGSEVVLPVTRQLRDGDRCYELMWRYGSQSLARTRDCNAARELNSNMRISENGSLIISPVTAKHAGRYNVSLYDSTGGHHIHTDSYTLHVEDPVSVPVLNILCLQDGRAQISCQADNRTLYIYLNVTGSPEGSYSSASNNITVITVPAPDPWSVTCTAGNRVSQEEITQIREACPVSLSGIAVNVSCLGDGSAEAFCWVDDGSDPQFSWSLNEKSQKGRSSSSYSLVTLPPPVSGILRCDVINKNSRLSDSKNIFCPVPASVPVIKVSCLTNGSAKISCEVQSGTDLSFSLTVNGTAKVYNEGSSKQRVSVTVPFMSSSNNISCFVRNSISNNSTSVMHDPCPAPLSAPDVTVSCQNNGSAAVSCVVEKDQNITYSWTVNGTNPEEYHSSTITFLAVNFTSGPLNVGCSVNNSLSTRKSNITRISCPAPVSVPLVDVSCLRDGSAVISCRVLSGTEPRFSLTLNGKSVSATPSWMGVNYTEHTKGPWNVSCTATNQLDVTETSHAKLTCSVACYTCLQKSIFWGLLGLLAVSPFYVFGYWFTLRKMKKS